MPIAGEITYPFRWHYRPESNAGYVPIPVVQVRGDEEEIPEHELPDVLRAIPKRQWSAIRQLLIEAKMKNEAYLRNDQIIANPSLSAYYQGQLVSVDYLLANFEGLRVGLMELDPEYKEGTLTG